jgi:ADP-ribose pyrophosphatase YjhB (NUDIX family)
MGLQRDLRLSRFCPHCGAGLASRRPPDDDRDRLVCTGCGFIFYLGLKVAAGTVPVQDGRIALIRRGVPPGKGLWSFPCGYAEMTETLEECAVRETLEEAGVEVRVDGLLGAYSYPPEVDDVSRVAVVAYAATVVGGEPRAGDDATEVRLVEPAAIPWEELAFRSAHDALRDWLGRQYGTRRYGT